MEPKYFDLTGIPGNDDHPSHDVANGQLYRESLKWNETLFVITYDEHGGFYDHVVTPYVGVLNPDRNLALRLFSSSLIGWASVFRRLWCHLGSRKEPVSLVIVHITEE